MTHAHPTIPLAVAALFTLSLGSACGPADPAEVSMAARVDPPRQALEVADSVLAANVEEEGPVQGFWPFLADDAVFLEPGLDIVQGRDAIRAALEAAQPATPTTIRLHRVSAGQSGDDGLGYTFGWLELLPEGGTTAYGKYIAMWRRAEGHWRLEAFVRSSGRGAPAIVDDGVRVGYHGVVLPGDPTTLAAGIESADLAFSAYSEPPHTYCDAFPAFADEHAIVFGGSNFYSGLDWVRLAYSGCTAANHAAWGPVRSATTGSGDLGYSVGNATFWTDLATGGTGAYAYQKYLTVWVRQQDGGWKWLLDAGSARPAP